MIARRDDIESDLRQPAPRAERIWRVGDLLQWTERYFASLGLDSPRLDAELLLAHAMGTNRLQLYTGYGQVVEEDERRRFRELVARRGRREPVAYLVGSREFYSLAFEVDRNVLIPRPETEHLVERVVVELRGLEREAPPRVLDLGTGSGNVAISIAAQVPAARVTGTDVCPGALAVAARNAARLGVDDRLELRRGDLFDAIVGMGAAPRFDAIVSNPPYVRPDEFSGLQPDVRDFEPRLALVDTLAADGLGFYRSIVARSGEFLSPGGLLAVEVGERQAVEVVCLFEQAGLGRVQVIEDLAGIGRVVWCRVAG